MKLIVNEIFYSLQGEGRFTGHPAVFLRLAGCNLSCPFCDTDHQSGEEMDAEDIVGLMTAYPTRHAVITGGEPGLQLTAEFVDRLHREGYFVQVETNGTVEIPLNVDWITCSPKTPDIRPERVDEIKLLFMGDGRDDDRIGSYGRYSVKCRSLQPCDHSIETDDRDSADRRNRQTMEGCIAYVKSHPEWSLSLQTHKLLDIP